MIEVTEGRQFSDGIVRCVRCRRDGSVSPRMRHCARGNVSHFPSTFCSDDAPFPIVFAAINHRSPWVAVACECQLALGDRLAMLVTVDLMVLVTTVNRGSAMRSMKPHAFGNF